uniref:DNA primase large subunit n=1 Tax=Eptatretus burgeri TaxID=7764 RepID=A0A8C4WXV5_EPTBU
MMFLHFFVFIPFHSHFTIFCFPVLKAVESFGMCHTKWSEKYQKKMEDELKKANLPYRDLMHVSDNDLELRRKDHISHFILRLAYCQSENLRRWFLQQEADLFRYRFSQQLSGSVRKFLDLNDLHYTSILPNEKVELKTQLINSTFGMKELFDTQDFYKVPFTDALDLVRGRKIFLRHGLAYIPHNDLVSIVLNDFRTSLSRALAVTARGLPVIQEDERLQPLLKHLSYAYIGQDYSVQKNVGNISLDQLDSLATRSFPLCMRSLHYALRDQHHLRHGGRLQYGLFLKGLGLSLEQALTFWRTEFARGSIDPEKFEKGYAYNIRHAYGKEGKRTDYTPYSCMKIIQTNTPGPGDHHGCPFRHTDADLLRQRLQSHRLSSSEINQVMEYVKGMHYQLACQKYFEFTHKVEDGAFGLSHPNQYFEESQKLLSGGQHAKRENSGEVQKPVVAPVTMPQSSHPAQSSESQSTQLSASQVEEQELLEECFANGVVLRFVKGTVELG